MDTDKLELIFKSKYEGDPSIHKNIDGWINYCDKHNIIMLHGEWLVETLNEGKMKGMVCIHNCEEVFHENVCPWLLVPKKFAEKALVLGYLP